MKNTYGNKYKDYTSYYHIISTISVFLIDTLLNMQYEEDDFHPESTNLDYDEGPMDELNNDDIHYYNGQFGQDDNYSDTITVDSKIKNNRKMLDDSKKLDKGYHKIKRTINHKKVDIEVYSTTNTPGKMIRDAVTGGKYREFRVGSLNEHQFFKVRWGTGEIGKDGTTLFFDSPEQYERHTKTEVSQSIKEKWIQKCAEIRNIAYDSNDNMSDYVVVK